MTATAVIPVKGLGNAKRRLATRLWSDERARLVLRLLARELDVLGSVDSIDRIIVVTSDERVKSLAEMKGALVTLQPDNGVNAAIEAGIAVAFGSGAETVAALHGDLPFIHAADVEALIQASETGVFVIAPDRKRIGTNAIVVRRTGPIGLRFGVGSFALHLAAARLAELSVREVERDGLGFDLDTPGDLIEYRRRRRCWNAVEYASETHRIIDRAPGYAGELSGRDLP
ncbi:hypothetical protein BH23CHL2_BH23CHL2_17540 [soil metagenome]